MTTCSQAADYTKVGVKRGDWAVYSYTGCDGNPIESSSDHDQLLGWRQFDIWYVILTNVTYWLTYYDPYWRQEPINMNPGTPFPSTVNITAQFSDFVVCAGLHKGDPVNLGSQATFNETTTMFVCGAPRTINRLILDWTSGNRSESFDFAFDQQTGVMIQFREVCSSPSGAVYYDYAYTMVSTNMWLPDFVMSLAVGAVIGVVALAVVNVVGLKRR